MGRNDSNDIRTYGPDDPDANKPLTRNEKEAEKEADRQRDEKKSK